MSNEKGKQMAASLWKKTADLGKKAADEVGKGVKIAADEVGKGVKVAADKIKEDSLQRKIKKLNPLFPDTYASEDFHLPNIIMLRDDAERKGIDVCEGAIGWLDNSTGTEILCLYDECVEMSKIQFIPAAECDAVYYVDKFDRNKFIRVDYIFRRAQEERLAELRHIAFMLGAKRCTVEIEEADNYVEKDARSFGVRGNVNVEGISGQVNQRVEISSSRQNSSIRSGKSEMVFKGIRKPQMPELKWFANDENIKRLIEMCLQNKRNLKTETLELSGSTCAAMSVKAATAIDAMIGNNKLNQKSDVEKEARKENKSRIYIHIEF